MLFVRLQKNYQEKAIYIEMEFCRIFPQMLNTYNAAGVSRRQDQNVPDLVKKMSTFWNLVTIFCILMENALKRVQTCLVLVH